MSISDIIFFFLVIITALVNFYVINEKKKSILGIHCIDNDTANRLYYYNRRLSVIIAIYFLLNAYNNYVTDENPENIFIYHYVEELISSYGSYYESNLNYNDLTLKEFSVLLRIRFQGVATQHDLVELFKVSGAYIAKLLRKFEDNGYIARKEDPENRRKKLVKLTDEGIKKTDELIEVIQNWEDKVTAGISEDEIKTLKEILFKITMI